MEAYLGEQVEEQGGESIVEGRVALSVSAVDESSSSELFCMQG